MHSLHSTWCLNKRWSMWRVGSVPCLAQRLMHIFVQTCVCTLLTSLAAACRHVARAELVSRLAREELQYVAPADRDIAAGADRSKPAALNRALRRLYPKDVLAQASHLVAVLDDDQARAEAQAQVQAFSGCLCHMAVFTHGSSAQQSALLLGSVARSARQGDCWLLQVVDRSFLQKLLPCMGTPGVCLVYTPPGYSNVAPADDVFDQVGPQQQCQQCCPSCIRNIW